MKPYADNIQTFAAMFEGYAAAAERFQEAAKTRDATATFIPLFEALNWAVALDERVGKHWTPAGKPLSWAWRDKIRDAEIMRGVRFVRNSVHHDWSDALELDEENGRTFPMTFPVVFFEWRWRPAADLPQRDREDKGGEAVYRSLVEGNPARHTLEALAQVFYLLRQLLEPSSLRPVARPPTVTVVPVDPDDLPNDPLYGED